MPPKFSNNVFQSVSAGKVIAALCKELDMNEFKFMFIGNYLTAVSKIAPQIVRSQSKVQEIVAKIRSKLKPEATATAPLNAVPQKKVNFKIALLGNTAMQAQVSHALNVVTSMGASIVQATSMLKFIVMQIRLQRNYSGYTCCNI